MNGYVISDPHLGHERIKEYCGRPENHEELMWNAMRRIGREDCLVHLGDVLIGEDEKIHGSLIDTLSCRKVLVMGNHDTKSWSWYMEHGWDFVCDSFKVKYAGKVICFSHKPQPWDGDWEVNVHGHLHNLGHRDNEYKDLKQWHRLYSPELMNYQPVELAKFIQEGRDAKRQ